MDDRERDRAAAARRDGDTLLDAALRLARHHLIPDLRAVAFVSDSTLTQTRSGAADAVRVELEHPDDDPVIVWAPYQLELLRNGGSFGELVATAGTARVWPRSDD